MSDRQALGRLGESLAAEFLNQKGYKEIGRNITLKAGEIDLLFVDGETVVLVEVKTQRSARLIDPIWKVSPAKQRKLLQLARFIAVKYSGRNIRIDAVTLYWKPEETVPTITHYQNIITT